jgi:EmrB/QacA subfamily drug resistance transporter
VNVASLIAARAAQGAGAALVMPLAMALLSAAFAREERGRALGVFSGITGLALIVGPVLGGFVVAGLTWQWIFWINVPIGLILIFLVLRRIPESFGPPQRLDVGALLLVTAAALAIVWGLMRGNDVGWISAEVAAAMLAGLVLTAAFVGWERVASEPMVPMRLFQARAFASSIAVSFLLYASMYAVVFFLPQFFQAGQGFGPLGAALRLLPWTATLFVFAPLGGTLVNRLGERRLVVGGLLAQAIGFAWVCLIVRPDLAFVHLIPPLVLAGAGVSIAMPAAQSAVLGAVQPDEVGKASGIFNTSRFLGGTFGIAFAVAAFAAAGNVVGERAFSVGFAAAIAVSAVLSLAAAITALALPANRELAIEQSKVEA